MSEKLTKAEKKEIKAEEKKLGTNKLTSLGQEFKKFITRGNVLDMSVGVIMGGAFGAIVTAFTNILLSVCTWGVPGGLKGLITVLPAINSTQQGVAGIGQSFASGNLVEATIQFAANQGVTITKDSATFVQWQNNLKTVYTLHGGTYAYNLSAVIDWGTFINAVISFLVISLSLFIVIKVATGIKNQRMAFEAALDKKIQPEAAAPIAPAPAPVPAPKPENIVLLTEIRDEIKNLRKSDAENKEAK